MFTIITDGVKLSRLIASIKKTGAAFDENVHNAACSCIAHAETHGDVTKASALVHAMPKSARRKALMAWFAAFAPLRAENDEEGNFSGYKLNKGKKAPSFNLQGAQDRPFWDFTKERTPAEFTVEGLLALIQRKVKTARDNGKLDQQGILSLKEKLATLDLESTPA